MAKVFEGLPFVKVYMDYILIHRKNTESHLNHVLVVLTCLRQYKFYLKWHKY